MARVFGFQVVKFSGEDFASFGVDLKMLKLNILFFCQVERIDGCRSRGSPGVRERV